MNCSALAADIARSTQSTVTSSSRPTTCLRPTGESPLGRFGDGSVKLIRLRRSVDVSDKLKQGSNSLYIVFSSAFIEGRILEEQHLGKGKHLPLWNGDPSRLFVRKAGYNCELARTPSDDVTH